MHIPEELNTQSGADQILMLSSPSKKNKKKKEGKSTNINFFNIESEKM